MREYFYFADKDASRDIISRYGIVIDFEPALFSFGVVFSWVER